MFGRWAIRYPSAAIPRVRSTTFDPDLHELWLTVAAIVCMPGLGVAMQAQADPGEGSLLPSPSVTG
jgi:hypothetical protein